MPFRRHFIGRLQSNKINKLVPLVDCVESVDSADLAAKLAQRAAADGRRLEVLAQVNVSGEDTKAGVAPAAVFELVEAIAAHDALELRGLMTIGLNSPDARQGGRRLPVARLAAGRAPGAVRRVAGDLGRAGRAAGAVDGDEQRFRDGDRRRRHRGPYRVRRVRCPTAGRVRRDVRC